MSTSLLMFEDHPLADPLFLVMAEEWAVEQPGTIPPINEVSDADPIIAHANYGRWIVECPVCGHGAIRYSSLTPLFICTACGDTEWTRVKLPDDHQDIADILLERPLDNQHWHHHETVDDLIAENQDNEVQVPGHLETNEEPGTTGVPGGGNGGGPGGPETDEGVGNVGVPDGVV